MFQAVNRARGNINSAERRARAIQDEIRHRNELLMWPCRVHHCRAELLTMFNILLHVPARSNHVKNASIANRFSIANVVLEIEIEMKSENNLLNDNGIGKSALASFLSSHREIYQSGLGIHPRHPHSLDGCPKATPCKTWPLPAISVFVPRDGQ